jgi:16S rRNA (guanine966-N2)-methyltransferase
MQILFGQFKGRRLLTPRGQAIRPTTGRMRDWLANVLRERFEGARVLDLFAGSGALGLEALSLGAAETVFVDRSPQALTLIRANLERLGLQPRARVLREEALRFLRPGRSYGRYGLVFVDPPYESTDFPQLMKALAAADILETDGIVAVEHPGGLRDPRGPEPPDEALRLVRQKAFGRSTISLFGHEQLDH